MVSFAEDDVDNVTFMNSYDALSFFFVEIPL
jgi:hypothetical protein